MKDYYHTVKKIILWTGEMISPLEKKKCRNQDLKKAYERIVKESYL